MSREAAVTSPGLVNSSVHPYLGAVTPQLNSQVHLPLTGGTIVAAWMRVGHAAGAWFDSDAGTAYCCVYLYTQGARRYATQLLVPCIYGDEPISRGMGSTAPAAEDARVAKRARLAPPAGDADLISGLDDDVLLRVLGLVGDARDAARTGALSRRWLGLWTRAPALRFSSQPGGFWRAAPASAASLERYAASVDAALARRARSGCAIERLSIAYAAGSEHYPVEQPSFADAAEWWIPCLRDTVTERILEQLMPASVRAARGWIGYAFRHGVKSFDLDLQLPLVRSNFLWERDGVEEVELDDELPSAVRLETMRLALGGAQLRLPAAMTFASLTNLSLERIGIAAGGAALLGHLVSSATCPRLQKLRVRWIYLPAFHEEMAIEADVLSELWMEDVRILMSLKLRTPRLRVLHIYKCFHVALRISAPRLEELAIIFQPACPPRWLEIDGDLPCVRSLKICLWSHLSRFSGYREADNDKNMLLLRQCSSLTCLQVFLRGAKVRLPVSLLA
jgi:hypothetical protein